MRGNTIGYIKISQIEGWVIIPKLEYNLVYCYCSSVASKHIGLGNTCNALIKLVIVKKWLKEITANCCNLLFVTRLLDRTILTPPICFSTWELASWGFFVTTADFLVLGIVRSWSGWIREVHHQWSCNELSDYWYLHHYDLLGVLNDRGLNYINTYSVFPQTTAL